MSKPKTPIPGWSWCYGGRDDEMSGFDCDTRLIAIEVALQECEEADTIYIAQHAPTGNELPHGDLDDLEEWLSGFEENCSLDDSWEHHFHDEKAVANLKARLTPLFANIQIHFRQWLADHQIHVYDFANQEELTREAAQAEVLAHLHKSEKADFALEQISGELSWVEGYLERNNSNLKSEALEAIHRIRAILDQQEESKREVSHE